MVGRQIPKEDVLLIACTNMRHVGWMLMNVVIMPDECYSDDGVKPVKVKVNCFPI